MSDTWYVGGVATLRGEFFDADGAPANPTTVTLTATAPDGSQTVHTTGFIHTDPGIYTFDQALPTPGVWVYEWVGEGAVVGTALGYLTVDTLGADSLRTGPCSDWCSIADVRALGPYADATALPDSALLRMIPVASRWLYARTGRQFPGICAATVRPSRRSIGFNAAAYPNASWNGMFAGAMFNWGLCGCDDHPSRDGCGTVPEVLLGFTPIRQVTEVRLDGHVLAPSAYRVDDHRWLVRVDGDVWPSCQDVTADPASAVNTFQVKLLHGIEPGADGVLAASVLAGELALSASGQTCRLPKKIQSLTRQGTTQTLLDPKALAENQVFGIPEIDYYVGAVNPNNLRRSGTISRARPLSTVRRPGV